VHLELSAPNEVPHGAPVPLALRLVNHAAQPATVYLQGRPTAFDVTVKNADGAVVWRRLDGQVVPAILGVQQIDPGAALSFDDVWLQQDNRGTPVPPGRYSIQAALPTDGPEPFLSAVVSIHLRPSG
jgi:hypothetical protein